MGVFGVMGMDAKLLGAIDRPRPWMDAEEAAEALGTTAQTMRRLARDGRSPAIVRRVGGRWRWSRADVERFTRGEPPRLG
jgi:excisionase family DNA binding protein